MIMSANPARKPADLPVTAPGAKEIRLTQGSRILASSKNGKLKLDPSRVGPGPFKVVPEVEYPDGSLYRGQPVVFHLGDPDRHVKPTSPLPEGARPGLAGDGVIVTSIGDRRGGLRLHDHVKKGDVRLDGWIEIPQKGDYELVVTGSGTLRFDLDGETLFDGEVGGRKYIALARDKGWHRVGIDLKSKAKPNLELMLGGDCVLAPLKLSHASAPRLKQQGKVSKALASLLDGKRGGDGVAVDEIALSLKRATKVGAVTLFPGAKAAAFPSTWTVEISTGYGKWKTVKDLRALAARPPRTAKDKPEIPLFVELRFVPIRAKKLRLRLKGKVPVAEVEVHGAAK